MWTCACAGRFPDPKHRCMFLFEDECEGEGAVLAGARGAGVEAGADTIFLLLLTDSPSSSPPML